MPRTQNIQEYKESPIGPLRSLVACAAIFVVLFGITLFTDLFSVILLGLVMAFLAAPLLLWLGENKVPTWAGTGIITLLYLLIGIALFVLTIVSLMVFAGELPQYQEELNANLAGLNAFLGTYGFSIYDIIGSDTFKLENLIEPAMTIAGDVSGVVVNGFFVLVVTAFILLELPTLQEKLNRSFGPKSSVSRNLPTLIRNTYDVMVVRTKTNVVLGGSIGAFLYIIGVDLAILWGVLTIILSYIPYIGLFIACVPAVILAWLKFGWGGVLIVLAGIAILNFVIENVVFAKIAANDMRLTPLAVAIALLIWTAVLGIVGMFLAIPLTVIMRTLLAGDDRTRWLAVLMSDDETDDGIV
ncbi:AI-2E family transporter [Methanogenium sp. S4BF]|uniref:AI-2E family transporter n=1 Tax=Methanogenium sp. S4BF TaxID=1789226 RepID=UPI002415D32E|nr:AI-2E family transporter [Methanogenium sp. S4BF]WFN33981.1 AI-2E family transporter [Methanogenium sp. S4BF]